MTPSQTETMQQCAALSLASKITFPEVLSRLSAINVERYHADYCRSEVTYYLTSGESLVVPTPHPDHPLALEFSAAAVEQAVRQSQQGEHTYADFVRKTMQAGCVGYFVQLTGQRVIYFGRTGDSHTEYFPSP